MTVSIIVVTVFILSIIAYQMQRNSITKQMQNEVGSNVQFITSEVNSYNSTINVLKDSLKQQYLSLDRSLAVSFIGKTTFSTQDLSDLAKEIGVAEIHIMNQNGILQYSNIPGFIGFDFASSTQSKPFLQAITNKNFSLTQDPTPRGTDKKLFMYVGVARIDQPGMIQIGIEPSKYEKVVNSFNLSAMVRKTQLTKKADILVFDGNGKVIADGRNQSIGKSMQNFPFGNLVSKSGSGSFYYTNSGQPMYLQYQHTVDGSLAVEYLNTGDYMYVLRQLLMTFFTIALILILLSAVTIWLLSNKYIGRSARRINSAIQEIANGNLLQELEIKSKDEFGVMGDQLNLMTASLRNLVMRVSESAEQVAASSEQLTASAEETAKATNQIASSIQEVAAGAERQATGATESAKAMENMAAGIQHIAETSSTVANSATNAATTAEEGNLLVQNTVQQMEAVNSSISDTAEKIKELNAHSKNIGQIVDVITGIADQTNLLALNAAIEAARAGEEGRGFAVVADEVRKLAEKSANSAQQIVSIIEQVKLGTEESVESMKLAMEKAQSGLLAVQGTGQSFSNILQVTRSVAEQIQEVSATSQEMSAETEEVMASIEEMASISEQSSANTQNVSAASEEQMASIEEIAESAHSLSKSAQELQRLISQFKL